MTQSERAADWIVGIDVGGTFTDIIALNRRTGETRDGKVLSTLQQEEGVLLSIERSVSRFRTSPRSCTGTRWASTPCSAAPASAPV